MTSEPVTAVIVTESIRNEWSGTYLNLFNAKQKHLGCKKRRGQSEAAVI